MARKIIWWGLERVLRMRTTGTCYKALMVMIHLECGAEYRDDGVCVGYNSTARGGLMAREGS